jgi:hypothetical protein
MGRRRGRIALATGAGIVSAVAVASVLVLGAGGDDQARRPAAVAPGNRATPTPTTVAATPDAVVPPRTADDAAATLIRVERGLRGDDRTPDRLRALGWEQQLAYRQLGNHPEWVAAVDAALPADVRSWVDANLEASNAVSSITAPEASLPDWTIVTPPAADVLRADYAEAEAATGIPWAYLAAINFLESRMGRIEGDSNAGAQGPMQFIPSTWDAYGNDGDVHDPHDAILAAARYLAAAGGPGDMRRAVYAYNHDDGYVAAVLAYARNLLDDPRAYDGYYQWQVYFRTVDGTVLLPEGYRPNGPVGARTLPPA